MHCNPADERVDFEDFWIINPAEDEHEACQLTRPKVQQNNTIEIVIKGITLLKTINKTINYCINHFVKMKSISSKIIA